MHEIANDGRITELEATVAQLEQEKLALQQQLDERDEASRLWLQAVFERSPVGLVVCDLAGRFVQANPAFQTLVGYSEAELRTMTFWALTAEPDRQMSEKAKGALLESEAERIVHVKRYVHRDGREVWAQVSAAVTRDAAGAPLCIVIAVEDISWRKETEQALIRAHADLERQRALTHTMINALPGAIAYCGPDGEHRAANDAAARRYGLASAAELVGKKAEAFIPEAHTHVMALAERVMATGEPYASYGDVLVVETPAGREVRHRDFLLTPVPPAHGGGFVVVALDATERVALEQTIRDQLAALQQADRYKDEFLSVVSHELRTPLNFITGFASLAQDGAFGPVSDGQHQAMERILAGADRMLGLVDNLLDVAKLSSGKLTPMKEATDYTALVEEAANAMYPLCESKRLKVALELEAGLEAAIDATLIDRVLLNLLSNAVKFTPEGGRVTVKAAAASGRIRTEVIDTGCGIAEADMPRLFQRFGQLDMSATRHHGGTGLGLAITKALIEMHGGVIGVESEPGAGSTFWFELPLA